MKRCPACGQTIPPDLVLNGPVLQRIYNELRRAPRTVEDLRHMIWGYGDISPHAIHVEMQLLRQRLRPHGLKVRCERSRGRWESSVFYLESLC